MSTEQGVQCNSIDTILLIKKRARTHTNTATRVRRWREWAVAKSVHCEKQTKFPWHARASGVDLKTRKFNICLMFGKIWKTSDSCLKDCNNFITRLFIIEMERIARVHREYGAFWLANATSELHDFYATFGLWFPQKFLPINMGWILRILPIAHDNGTHSCTHARCTL